MNGSIKLPVNGKRYFTVWGGSFYHAPMDMVTVKLAPEVNYAADIYADIPDFGVPDRDVMDAALRQAVYYIGHREQLYVGCFGGIGRTGLFLALLAKAFGVVNPVQYVRDTYTPRAVETPGQEDFVNQYRVPKDVLEAVDRYRARYRWYFFRTNLTKQNPESGR